MSAIELDRLGSQVDRLMNLVESLQFENASLRQKIAVHIKESARLQHKNFNAAKQIKHIIKHIREELS
jgi:uncharacterized protein (TIGR02449 family)